MPPTIHSDDQGFTWTQLVVVFGIIAMLAALLLPAIQKVREASQRLQCANNLKQLGLAVQNYHSTYNRFPSNGNAAGTGLGSNGWGDLRSHPTGDYPTRGWGIHLLPFLELDSLLKAQEEANQNQATPGGMGILRGSRLGVMLCPARAARSAANDDDPSQPPVWMGDYCGMLSGWNPTQSSSWDVIIAPLGNDTDPIPPVTFQDLTDGSSTTILFAEKFIPTISYSSPGASVWSWDAPGWPASFSLASNRPAMRAPCRDDDLSCIAKGDVAKFLGSSHANGMNMVMGDGSVQQLKYGVADIVIRALGKRNDGLLIDLNSSY
jgi:prepilin-type processing-associated H-X9-DG protein